MGPPEKSVEIGGVGIADAATHIGHTEIGLDEQPAGLCHAALHDPFLHGTAGSSTYRSRQMPRPQRPRSPYRPELQRRPIRPKAAQDEQSTGQGAVWLYHLSKINFSTHHYLVT